MKSLVIFFLKSFAIIFTGFCLANILRVIITCLFSGDTLSVNQIIDLPYLLYLIFSLIISAIFAIILHIKSK